MVTVISVCCGSDETLSVFVFPAAEVFKCSPSCSPKAVCMENNTCVCRPFYEGDGFTCTGNYTINTNQKSGV